MNILVGESTKTSGNYSLFAETQMLSLTWSAEPDWRAIVQHTRRQRVSRDAVRSADENRNLDHR